MTKVSELSNIYVVFAVCEHKLIAKVPEANNLCQRKIVGGNLALMFTYGQAFRSYRLAR